MFGRRRHEIKEVQEVEVAKLEPGDFVILKSNHPLSRAQMDSIRRDLLFVLPSTVTLVILDRGLELEVIRPKAQALTSSPFTESEDLPFTSDEAYNGAGYP